MTNGDHDDNLEDRVLDPDSETWDDRVGEILKDNEYDEDLGRRMARDAIRVARGELSDEAFHERYREEVISTFDNIDWESDSEANNK